MISQEGIDSLKRLGVHLRGLIELADALEGVNSIEQSANEARARLDALGKQCDAKESELKSAQAAINEAKAVAEQTAAEAAQNAERVKAQAEVDAQSIKDEANAVAAAVLTEARQKAAKAVKEAEARAETSNAAAQTAEARKESAEKVAAEKAKELADLLRKIDEAKSTVARMLGK